MMVSMLFLAAIAANRVTVNALPKEGEWRFAIAQERVTGGGGEASGGIYSITGTLGEAAVARSHGGIYLLESGAIDNDPSSEVKIFTSGFES